MEFYRLYDPKNLKQFCERQLYLVGKGLRAPKIFALFSLGLSELMMVAEYA
jgi:hypothetical protein